MSMSGTGVDHGIGCSDLPEFCSDAKDSFTETMMNLNALNGEGDHINSSSTISGDKHGSFRDMSTDDIIHNIDVELSENSLPDSKGLSKLVENVNSPVMIIASPDEKPNSYFVKENSVNGQVKNICHEDTKEISSSDLYCNFVKLTAPSKDKDTCMKIDGSGESSKGKILKNIDQLTASSKAEPESANTDFRMKLDNTTECVEHFSHVNQGSNKNVHISSDDLGIVNTSGQSSFTTKSHIYTDASCENSVSCSKDSNICLNSVDHNSAITSSTNHEQDKSVPSTGLDLNQASPVSDKNKTKHLYDGIPLNPLTIHDKVRNSIRDIMFKVKHSKTTELTKTCSKNKSHDTASLDKTCDTTYPGKTCDTTFRAEGKLSSRKDNLFESITEFSEKPKLDERKLDSSAKVDPDPADEELATDTEQDADMSETNQNSELHLELEDSFESEPKTNSSDLVEDEIDHKMETSREEKKDEESAVTTDTSNDSESQSTTAKCERIFNANNSDHFPNSVQSDKSLIDNCEVDKTIALIDDSDDSGSPLTPASVSNMRQTSPPSEGSQSVSSENKNNVEKMETGDVSNDNDDVDHKPPIDNVDDLKSLDDDDDDDLKPPDLISDKFNENSTDCDSSEVQKSKVEEKSIVRREDDESTENTVEADPEMPSICDDNTNERKRAQEDQPDCEQPPKRSRLDEVIGKLGSVIGISPETVEQVDSDSDSEESRHSESSGIKSEAEDVTSVSDEDDDKASQATSQSSTKTVRLSCKELEALVRSKVQCYMSVHQDDEIVKLRKKVADLQEANDKWKTQARELQKQVVDLTVLKQKLEKRKAATAALRQITTKAVGIQVSLDEPKTSAVTQRLAKTPPRSNAIVTHSPVVSQSVTVTQANPSTVTSAVKPTTSTVTLTSSAIAARNSVTQLLSATAMPRVSTAVTTVITSPIVSSVGVRPQLTQHLNNAASTVRSLLDNARGTETVRLQSVPNSIGSSLLVVSPITQQNSTQTSVNSVPKVIDLTADDDGQPKPGQVVQAVQVLPPGASVSQLRPANLHQLPQQVIRQMGPQAIPGTSILLSSPTGTPILNNAANLNCPGGTFQVVTIPSGSNLRPGTLLTMVPATSTQLSSVRPQGVSVAKQISPQSMPQLRAGQPTQLTYTTTSVRPSPPAQSMRPPPPLMSAPPPQTQTVVRVGVTPTSTSIPSSAAIQTPRHPAPLPATPVSKVVSGKPLPPKPSLKISRVSQGIVLSWNVTSTENVSDISSYQLFAYQETSSVASTSLWKKVGDVKALPLPMACTLTQFQEGNKYHFAVRAVDQSGRFGDFSEPSTIHLTSKP